jgi:hypothetical protein
VSERRRQVNVWLSPSEEAKLDALRERLGLRSRAETFRVLLNFGMLPPAQPVPEENR